MSSKFRLDNLGATEALAARLAQALQPPLVVGLSGDLGAGKTALVRALIQSLQPATRVKSPTYTLIESYELPGYTIHHLDLYRVQDHRELAELGLADLLTEDAVLLIEWPEQGGADTPQLDLALRLHRVDENARELTLEAFTSAGRNFLGRVEAV
jgi:tRNA threonylcarbamoyladenosine biosynthesis protein TsaE